MSDRERMADIEVVAEKQQRRAASMTLDSYLKGWLLTPPISGKQARAISLVMIAVPTLTRAALDGIVVGIGFSPYFPFVLLSAVLMGRRYAAVVALASAIVADGLFVGPPYQLLEGPTDVFGAFVFLGSSALIIGFVQAIRSIIDNSVKSASSAGGIIFSLERGEAWASWPEASYYIRLGPRDEVADMMQDFLAQVELGKRLTKEIR